MLSRVMFELIEASNSPDEENFMSVCALDVIEAAEGLGSQTSEMFAIERLLEISKWASRITKAKIIFTFSTFED